MFFFLNKKNNKKNVVCAYKMLNCVLNKAKSISVELLELNLKKKLEEAGKTRWNGKKQKNWKKKTPKTVKKK